MEVLMFFNKGATSAKGKGRKRLSEKTCLVGKLPFAPTTESKINLVK